MAPDRRSDDLRRTLARSRSPKQSGAAPSGIGTLRFVRGRADDIPAGGDRRRPQLGLPVLLGEGFGVRDARFPGARSPSRNRGLLLVADAGIPAHAPQTQGALS